MSIRPHDGGKPPVLPRVTRWPRAPNGMTLPERVHWQRIGEMAREIQTIGASDLPLCVRLAQVSARVDAALLDPSFKPTALNALMRLELDYSKQLGFSPQSRRAVAPLPDGEKKASGFEDVE